MRRDVHIVIAATAISLTLANCSRDEGFRWTVGILLGSVAYLEGNRLWKLGPYAHVLISVVIGFTTVTWIFLTQSGGWGNLI